MKYFCARYPLTDICATRFWHGPEPIRRSSRRESLGVLQRGLRPATACGSHRPGHILRARWHSAPTRRVSLSHSGGLMKSPWPLHVDWRSYRTSKLFSIQCWSKRKKHEDSLFSTGHTYRLRSCLVHPGRVGRQYRRGNSSTSRQYSRQ